MWHDETRRTVPAGTVEDQQGEGTDADAVANFDQMFVHGRDADGRHDQRGAGAARRADGAEQVGPGNRVNRRSRLIRGRVPRLAQMPVSVPCWPTRASS